MSIVIALAFCFEAQAQIDTVVFSTTDGSSILTSENITPKLDTIAYPFIATFSDEVLEIGGVFGNNEYLIEIKGNKIKYASNVTNCKNLIKVSFPNAPEVSGFSNCISLATIDFPVIEVMAGESLFNSCDALTYAIFGTGFREPTYVNIENGTFYGSILGRDITKNIELILGENVLPERNGNYWNGYYWKSIKLVGIKEIDDKFIRYLGNNRYILENINNAELYDIIGNLIEKLDDVIVDLSNYIVGIYFIVFLDSNKNIRTEKIIKN
jgi:hypothetical protein